MELMGLDVSFQPIKNNLTCINIQWNRRYYEVGDYAIQLRASDWNTDIVYIYTSERPEMGMVQKVETEHTVKGDFVNVSGFFLEGMLKWAVIYPAYSWSANLADMCRDMVWQYLHPDIPWLALLAPLTLGSETTVKFENGEELAEATYAALKEQELSQYIRYDYVTSTLYYSVWQGKDRTQDQDVNPYALFGQDVGTVDTMTLTMDESAYKNYALALYDGGVTSVDLRTVPEPRRVLYVDTGMTIEEGQSQEEFIAQVQTEARKQLKEFPRIVNIDATVLQNNSLYLVDYDLGDKCDVRDDRLQLAFATRIVEVNEVWKNNEHTVALQFGDKIPTEYRRGR